MEYCLNVPWPISFGLFRGQSDSMIFIRQDHHSSVLK
jgi:hypothetical protein